MEYKAPDTVTFAETGFCPGCGHGIAIRLIAEVVEEMELSEKLITTVDVACGSLNIDQWRFDTIMSAHGRPIAVAVGIKKVRKDNPVMCYIGDGAAYAIGLAETMHAALRNDNVVVIVINNSLFGMTGGQMAPTSLPGQKTASSPQGKDPAKYGMPFDIKDALAGMNIAYLARAALTGVSGIATAKKYIRKAFEKHMRKEGFCLVELLSTCPTNMYLSPVDSMEFVKNKMTKYFPLGEFKDKEGVL